MNENEKNLLFYWVLNNEYERVCTWIHNNSQLIPEILAILDSNGWNVMHHAAFQGYEKILECFLALNADVDTRDSVGQTPLMLSASRNCMGAVRLLLQYGAEVDAVNNEGQTALFESFEVGTFNVAKLLVEAGSNVNLTDNMHFNLIMWIAWNGMEWVNFLEDLGIDIECASDEGWTALFLACKHNNTGIMEALLNRGADYTRPDSQGNTVWELVNQLKFETKRIFEEYLLRTVTISSPSSNYENTSSSDSSQISENWNEDIPHLKISAGGGIVSQATKDAKISSIASEILYNQYDGYQQDIQDRDQIEQDNEYDRLPWRKDV